MNETDSNTDGTDRTKVVVAECPMSWCDFQAVVENPLLEYDAAFEVEDHVNEAHSEADIGTLRPIDTETAQDGDSA